MDPGLGESRWIGGCSAPLSGGDAGATQLPEAQGSPCSASRDFLAGVSGSCIISPQGSSALRPLSDGETEAGSGAGGGRKEGGHAESRFPCGSPAESAGPGWGLAPEAPGPG